VNPPHHPSWPVFRYLSYAATTREWLADLRYELDGREFAEQFTLRPPRWRTDRRRTGGARLVFCWPRVLLQDGRTPRY